MNWLVMYFRDFDILASFFETQRIGTLSIFAHPSSMPCPVAGKETSAKTRSDIFITFCVFTDSPRSCGKKKSCSLFSFDSLIGL